MGNILLTLAAVLLLTVAVYTQRQIGNFTKGFSRIATTRLILGAVGIGFGLVSAAKAGGAISETLVFLIGFGLGVCAAEGWQVIRLDKVNVK